MDILSRHTQWHSRRWGCKVRCYRQVQRSESAVSFERHPSREPSLILALETRFQARTADWDAHRATSIQRLYFCYFLICIACVHFRSLLLNYVHAFPGRRCHVASIWARAKYNERGEAFEDTRPLAVYGLAWPEGDVGPHICIFISLCSISWMMSFLPLNLWFYLF